ncbi:MAG: tyrosine--tRNA ligase, partial [Acidimicrobiia bacterium]
MDVLEDLQARGLIDDSTGLEALGQRLRQGPVTLYHGIDPTADSLHTGNLVGLLVLRRFQAAGHRPLALAGGATGMIGDPSGRSEERNLLDGDALRANVEAIKAQISRVLGPGGEWQLVDNLEWTAGVTVLDFLRDVGKHVTVNQMVARESVRQRMASEQGISFTEFSYMLLQAHDFLHMFRHDGVSLQIGGSDQFGNITAGTELIRRAARGEAHGLTFPVLTDASGRTFGKTESGAVWLDAARTSPYRFYQFWINADDADVGRLLRTFTLLDRATIEG